MPRRSSLVAVPAAAEAAVPGPADESRPRLRAVIADDSTASRALARASLRDVVDVVGEAADGAAAVTTVERLRPDLVLLDLAMPEMDGLEAAARIRALTPEVKVLVLSAYAASRMEQQALAAGADRYLEKAADPTELVAAIAELFPGTQAAAGPLEPMVAGEVAGAEGPYRALLDALDEAVLLLDAEGAVRDANFAATQTLGRPTSELFGRPLADLGFAAGADPSRSLPALLALGRPVSHVPASLQRGTERRRLLASLRPLVAHGRAAERQTLLSLVDLTELEVAQDRYRLLAENLPGMAVFTFDADLRFITASGAGLPDMGWAAEELLGRSVLDLGLGERGEDLAQRMRACIAGESQSYDVVGIRAPRTWAQQMVPLREPADGAVVGGMLVASDVTDRRRNQRRLAMLAAASEALVRVREERQLLQDICDITTEVGGYRLSWVGVAVAEGHAVEPIAQSGFEEGYLERVRITWDDVPRGQGPTGRAVRTHRPQVSRDIVHDPAMAPWRDDALARGYESSAAVPFVAGDRTYVFHAYASRPDAFEEPELATLTQLAENLAVGLGALQAEQDGRRARAALELTQRRYAETLVASPISLFEQDRELRYTWMHNPHLGFDADVLLGRTDAELVPPDEAARLTAIKRRVLETGVGERADVRATGPDGPGWFDLSVEPLRAPDGSVAGVRCLTNNITDRRRAEDALRASEARFRSVIDAVPDPLFLFRPLRDEQGTVTDLVYEQVNAAATRLYQRPAEEIVGRRQLELFPSVRDIGLLERYAEVIETGEPASIEVPAFDENGVAGWFELTASRFGGGLIVTARDVTERALAQARIAEQTALLERSNADLQAFAYAASHDLKEPLLTIDGFTRLLTSSLRTRGVLLDDEAEFVDLIGSGLDRMRQLVDGLLALSRVATHGVEPSSVDLADVVADALGNLHAAIEAAGAQVAVGPLPTVTADRAQLVQLVQNLVANAVKFTAPGVRPEVVVEAERAGAEWLVTVADEGIGIPEAQRERVFEPFTRLRDDEHPGSGIGLATCRRIVQRHGGRIWVEDGPGGTGSRLCFTLPARAPGTPPGGSSSGGAPPVSPAGGVGDLRWRR